MMDRERMGAGRRGTSGKGPVSCLPETFQAMLVNDGGLLRSGPSWHLFLPAEGSRVGLVCVWGGVVSSSVTTSLPLADRNMRVQKVFNGHLRVTNEKFLDAYENPNSTEFTNLASQVKEAVSLAPGKVR